MFDIGLLVKVEFEFTVVDRFRCKAEAEAIVVDRLFMASVSSDREGGSLGGMCSTDSPAE